MSEIKDIGLYESGERKIQWVKANMPLLRALEEEFSADKPFKGLKVALSVHLEAKTAYLCRVLAAGGANMYITGSNPLSTQDDVAAALRQLLPLLNLILASLLTLPRHMIIRVI